MTYCTDDRLIHLRRDFHQHPEPGWCEFETTIRIIEELERIGIGEIHMGSDAVEPKSRLGVPTEDILQHWFEKTASDTDRLDILENLRGGLTGVVAVLNRGKGPVIGLRVDIDALPIHESMKSTHGPTQNGFVSKNSGFMHACGHDAHITIGLGVIEAVADSEFSGTLKVFFQPAEEKIGGGKPMASTDHVADIEYLFGLHIGLGVPTGGIVAGYHDPLAISKYHVEYTGESAHAGLAPNEGRNAVQALSVAVNNLYAIPRHGDGGTRVNVGELHSPNAPNIIGATASAKLELRGESTELIDYLDEKALNILKSIGEAHQCEVETELHGHAPSEDSDEELIEIVARVAAGEKEVTSVRETATFGASEDFTHFVRRVRNNGGVSTFVGIGTDHPGGHHNAEFDIDERSLAIGVAVLSKSILKLE